MKSPSFQSPRTVIVLTLLSLTLTACMSFSERRLRPVRESIEQQLPEIRLEKEIAIAVGGGMFNFLDLISHNEADLSEVDHLQVAVYEVFPRRGYRQFSDDVFHQSLNEKDGSLLWERIVKVNEEDEQVWVFVGMDMERESLDAVAVFVVERNELVMMNVDGELHELIRFAFAPARGKRGAYRS